MFLDDELKQIYSKNIDIREKCIQLIDACIKRIELTSDEATINSIKRIDSSFRLFAKTTNTIKEDGFKNQMIELLKVQKNGNEVINLLNW